ncbi:MAG TPA: hypothetical protein EYQ42_05185 [Thiotrichaceae bacterium]|jgi:signal transduction histidine kinase|nr:hypothetical protein [Thiotrichaceae bacterium]HIM08672.1 hypothetical protein [Gammaproteobacteria bacterium]
MTTRAYILYLFLTAITGVITFDLVVGNSYDVLTNKGNEANQNRIVIEQIEHIQKHLPLILIVADLIIGSSETYLQDDALLEITTLKGQLDHVGRYALVQSSLSQLAVIDKQLDTISSQLVDAGKIIKTENKKNLTILLSKFDYTSLALIRTLNAFHESLRIQADHVDAQLVADKEKKKIIIYTMMSLLLILFFFFTHLALKNIDTPIRLMTTAANNALLFGQPYTAEINGSIEVNRLSQAMNSFIGKLESAIAKKTLVINKLKSTNQELIDTQLQLIQVEKLETTGTLAAGVAHEVKNPLAIIQFGIEYIAKDKHINSDLARVIDDIEDAVARADAVIKSLLDFTSMTQLKFDFTDINPVVTESISLLKHEILKKNINLTLELGDNLPQVEIDKNKIQQVLVNLTMNAIHAMDDNGVLSIKTYATTCKEISAIKNLSNTDQCLIGNNAVVIETEDNGIGISNEIIDKIFDPFFTMKWNGKGTGLGLTVVQNIVRLHKAVIKIKNRKHHGVNAVLIFRAPINKQMNNRVQS